jgi:hypothetical protein
MHRARRAPRDAPPWHGATPGRLQTDMPEDRTAFSEDKTTTARNQRLRHGAPPLLFVD